MLEHGGKLLEAAKEYGRPVKDWLDLSTGINHCGWTVPPVPSERWLRLPERDDELEEAAKQYYGSANLLPIAGSQAAIQALPKLAKPGKAGFVEPSYNEHRHAWARSGHECKTVLSFADSEKSCLAGTGFYDQECFESVLGRLSELDTLVLCNPNNPTGLRFSSEQITELHRRLAGRGGWLVVDEAFADGGTEKNAAGLAGLDGLIVLRSLGKFFGLAGARVGFIFAWPALLEQLQDEIGPWSVTGPSRWIAAKALNDRTWYERTKFELERRSKRLRTVLSDAGLKPCGGTTMFQWVVLDHARALASFFAANGILVRLFSEPPSLRFGLPASESDWERLTSVLKQLDELNILNQRADRFQSMESADLRSGRSGSSSTETSQAVIVPVKP